MRETYPRAIELTQSGKVDLKSIVSHEYSLEDHRTAFDTAVQRSGLKVVIHPN
jgi:L-iditol 2-dehydrogenase